MIAKGHWIWKISCIVIDIFLMAIWHNWQLPFFPMWCRRSQNYQTFIRWKFRNLYSILDYHAFRSRTNNKIWQFGLNCYWIICIIDKIMKIFSLEYEFLVTPEKEMSKPCSNTWVIDKNNLCIQSQKCDISEKWLWIKCVAVITILKQHLWHFWSSFVFPYSVNFSR